MSGPASTRVSAATRGALAALALALAATASGAPSRVVSINVCTDALLAELLPRERIASVTFLGGDPRWSPRAERLAGVPRNRGGADEVLSFRPDLVVAGRHARTATVTLLRRLDVPVAELALATSLDDARAQVLALAARLDVPSRGREVVAEMDRLLAAARAPADAPRPRTVLLRPGGFTSGPDTLAGAVLRHAGYHNLAGELGVRGWGFLSLEQMLLADADVVVMQADDGEAPSLAAALLEHPALRSAVAARRTVTLSESHLECPGPWVAEAALVLARARPRGWPGAAPGAPMTRGPLLAALAAAVAVLFALSLATGRAGGAGVFAVVSGDVGDPALVGLILAEVRLPRALLGVLVGAVLGLAGAALQGYLRNPLAEPSLVGASASGALGAVAVIYLGGAGATALAAPLGGVAGALAGLALVLALAGRDATPLTLILAGVAVNSLAAALTSLALNLAPSPYAVLEIVFWLLGSLADRSHQHVALMAPFALAGGAMLFAARRALDALTLGEDAAWSLGFGPRRTRALVIGGAGIAVGAAVAVAGSIGFVGLVVPHLLRPLVGNRPGDLLAPSALGGAALVLAADVAVRLVPGDVELKIGVVTALAGAPLFLWLLHRLRRELP